MLVCNKHEKSSENDKLLKNFTDKYLQDFDEYLTASFKDVKITMHNQANFVSYVSYLIRKVYVAKGEN